MDNTNERSINQVDIDVQGLIGEAVETVYPDFKSAEEIATQLSNVLGYFGATSFHRYLRKRILVSYSWHLQTYLVTIRVQYLTELNGA